VTHAYIVSIAARGQREGRSAGGPPLNHTDASESFSAPALQGGGSSGAWIKQLRVLRAFRLFRLFGKMGQASSLFLIETYF
jgi:hypothetical protein